MKNTKLITILTLLCTSLLKADCGGGGNTFLAATGGSFVGSCLSNAIMNRPRQTEVIVQQAPPQYVPATVPVNDPEMDYERISRAKSRRRAQALEQRRIELELIKEENKKEELAIRRLELERKHHASVKKAK